jgi:hypothetical protein
MAANDEHAEVMKAAMMLFSKQNCTPRKCMSLNTMNRRLSDPWDALTANENNIYTSELTYFHNDCQVISLFISSICL